MRYKAPSIKASGGLKVWLEKRRPQHNGFGYREFVTMYLSGVNPTNIARAFGKHRATSIKNWIRNYLDEQQAANYTKNQIKKDVDKDLL